MSDNIYDKQMRIAGLLAILPTSAETIEIQPNEIKFISQPGYVANELMIHLSVTRKEIYRIINQFFPITPPDVKSKELFWLRFRESEFVANHYKSGWELVIRVYIRDIMKQVLTMFNNRNMDEDLNYIEYAINNN